MFTFHNNTTQIRRQMFFLGVPRPRALQAHRADSTCIQDVSLQQMSQQRRGIPNSPTQFRLRIRYTFAAHRARATAKKW